MELSKSETLNINFNVLRGYKNSSKIIEKLNVFIIMLCLLIFSGAFSWYFEIFAYTYQLILLCHSYTLIWALTSYNQVISWTKNNKYLLFIIFIALSSVFWSENFSTTLIKNFQLLLTTLFAVMVTIKFTAKKFLGILETFLWILVLMSLIAVYFFPHVGIADGFHMGSWKGVFGQKNTFGIILVYLIVIRISKMIENISFINSITILFLYAVLLKTGSMTSILIVTFLFSLAIFLCILKKTSIYLKMIFISLSCVFLSIVSLFILNQNINNTTDKVLNRDSTLTGRTLIWEVISQNFISSKLIEGYGYGYFWSSSSPYIIQFQEMIRFKTITSHNGYLDLILDLGLIGAILLVILIVKNYAKSIIIFFKDENNYINLWVLLTFTMFLIYNFSESLILKENSIYWILIVVISTYSQRTNYRYEHKQKV